MKTLNITGTDKVLISGLTINSPQLVSQLERVAEEEREQQFLHIVNMGVAAVQAVGPAAAMSDFKEKMDLATQRLCESIGEQIEGFDDLLKDALDTNKRNSALSQFIELLKKEVSKENGKIAELIEQQFKKLNDDKIKEDATAAAEYNSPKKGFVFEDEVKELIFAFAKSRNEEAEHVGKTNGIGTSKVGDFTYKFAPTSLKIVVEAKNVDARMSISKIQSEVESAMKNRKCEFAILVVKNKSMLPESFGGLHFGTNYIACDVANLEVSLKFKAVQELARALEQSGSTIDVTLVNNLLELAKAEATNLEKVEDLSAAAEKQIKKVTESLKVSREKISVLLEQACQGLRGGGDAGTKKAS